MALQSPNDLSSTTGTNTGCTYCGPYTLHTGLCPKIQEIEYHPNGSIKRVKLYGPWSESDRALRRVDI